MPRSNVVNKFLKCQVEKGIFSDEKTVLVTNACGDKFSFFVSKEHVRDNKVCVTVRTSGDHMLATIPTNEPGSVVEVKTEDIE